MRKSIIASALITAALTSGVAFANSHHANNGAMSMNSGWYVGVGTNRSSADTYDVDIYSSEGGSQTTQLSLDDMKYGWSVLAGKHITDMFSLEWSYNSYGDITANDDIGSVERKYSDMWSTSLMGVISSPTFSGFSAHAKLGAAYFSETAEETLASGTYTKTNYDATNFAYGVGMQYQHNKFGVSVDWTRMDTNNDNSLNDEAYIPDEYSLTFIYNLG